MATIDRPAEAQPAAEAPLARPSSDAAARAHAYLDLWERHLTEAAVSGPIGDRLRPTA